MNADGLAADSIGFAVSVPSSDAAAASKAQPGDRGGRQKTAREERTARGRRGSTDKAAKPRSWSTSAASGDEAPDDAPLTSSGEPSSALRRTDLVMVEWLGPGNSLPGTFTAVSLSALAVCGISDAAVFGQLIAANSAALVAEVYGAASSPAGDHNAPVVGDGAGAGAGRGEAGSSARPPTVLHAALAAGAAEPLVMKLLDEMMIQLGSRSSDGPDAPPGDRSLTLQQLLSARDGSGMAPLHLAASAGAVYSSALTERLIAACPAMATEVDGAGRLPAHLAFAASPPQADVIRLLLRENPIAAHAVDPQNGCLLHTVFGRAADVAEVSVNDRCGSPTFPSARRVSAPPPHSPDRNSPLGSLRPSRVLHCWC